MVKIRARAWRAFEKLRKVIEYRPINELVWLTEKTKSPDVLLELRESMEQGQYENFMKWETMDLLAGLLEFKIAILSLKNEGSIKVLEDEPRERAMAVSERGLHGFRTIVRKMGRMEQEDKAAIYRLLDPNPVMIFGNKAEYDALPEKEKAAFDAATAEGWINGMVEALRILEALTADGTVKVLPNQEETGPDSHDRSRFQET